MNPYQEASKLFGGVLWIVGIIALLVEPIIGVLILLVALAVSVRSVQQTRERRHQELLKAQRPPA